MNGPISINFGANNKKRVMKFMRASLLFNFGLGVCIAGMLFLFGDFWVILFLKNNAAQVGELAVEYIRMIWPAFLISGINIVITGYFTSTLKAGLSFVFSALRSLVLPILFILLLNHLFMREKLYSFELKNTSYLYKVALSLIDYSDNIFNCEIINFVQTYKFDLSNMTDHRKYEYILGRYGSVKAVEQLMECSRLYIKSGIFNNPYLIGVDSIDISIAHSDNYVTAIAFDRDIIIGLDCQTIDTRTSIKKHMELVNGK